MKKFITIFSVIAFAYANAEVVKDEAYYIKKHIIIGTDTHEECTEESSGYSIEKEEMFLHEVFLYQELKKQNFKFPSQKEFESKIYHILGKKFKTKTLMCHEYEPLEFSHGCMEEPLSYGGGFANMSFVFFKDKKFMTLVYRFPEIVNYQKKYPYLLKMEKKLKKFHQCDPSDKRSIMKINRWKDVPQYGKIVQKNLDNFVNLNNYIFNDDKSKIPQVFNDNSAFFSSLVREYGYTKDKNLLNWHNKEYKTNLKVGEKLKLERDGEWFHREKKK